MPDLEKDFFDCITFPTKIRSTSDDLKNSIIFELDLCFKFWDLQADQQYLYLNFFGLLRLSLLLWNCGHAYPCLQSLGGFLQGSVL